MFDAHSELVKVDPKSTTVTMYASLSSLDLIEPLGKSSGFNFVDTRETCNQKLCIDDMTNGVDEHEEFFRAELQHKFQSIMSAPIQDSVNSGNATICDHKMVLTSISSDGYVHTQLLDCATLQQTI